MPLIKGGQVIGDSWRHLTDDEAVPDGVAVTVSLQRWTKERDTLQSRSGQLGLRLPNDAAPAALAGDIARFGLIVLSFPRFTDGRAYSQARLLRGRLGYRGELRAAGNVLRDQLLFMTRCGIDALEIGDHIPIKEWLAALKEIDVFYQPAEDHAPFVMRRRSAKGRNPPGQAA